MSKGTEYTLKVMEDLDALLADLQSTTTQSLYNQQGHLRPQNSARSGPGGLIQDYQTNPVGKQNQPTSSTILQQRQNYQTSPSLINSQQLRSSQTPPPLPPPPQDIPDTIPPPQQFDDQPLYEVQNLRCDNSISGSSQGSGDQAYQYSRDTSQAMSMISNNLSELDQLLNDLNSAQFMAEVDKKHTQTTGKMVPPVAPKPGKGVSDVCGSTVDSLLDHLETAVPSDQNGGYPVIKNTTTTNYTYQSAGFHEQNQPSRYEEQTSAPLQPQQSVATQELDDLMATLSDFKMKDKGPNSVPAQQGPVRRSPSPGSEPSYAKPQKSRNQSQSSSANSSIQSGSISGSSVPGGQLESMLGDLQLDLSKQGVNTKTKGLCAACNQPVVGQVITALGKIWHIEHFTCAHCHETLGTKNFYERDGVAYCERDYHSLFAPRCAYCNGPIVDKCVTALTKTWHPEHFFCAQCGRPFGEEGFHERDGKAYCRADFFEMFAPKCGGCGCAIVDNYISALNRHWHPECFACWDCHQPFGGGSFFDYEGLPYCETHYHAKRGSLCAGCQKPISGRCITAMYKKFHPEHFVCAFCLKQLNKGTFKEQNDRPYCHPCFVKLFG